MPARLNLKHQNIHRALLETFRNINVTFHPASAYREPNSAIKKKRKGEIHSARKWFSHMITIEEEDE